MGRLNRHQAFYKTIHLTVYVIQQAETGEVFVYASPLVSEGDMDVCEHLYQEGDCSLEDVIRSKINSSPYHRCTVKGNG